VEAAVRWWARLFKANPDAVHPRPVWDTSRYLPHRRRLRFERKAVVTDLECLLCGLVYPFHLHPQPTSCLVCGGTVAGRFVLITWLPLRPIAMP
jgi:hypothetical protein